MIIPDYQHSIIQVSRSILKYYQAYQGIDGISVLDDVFKDNYQHVVLMLLDGLGVSSLKAHLKPNDFLRKYQKDTISSVFPPTTVAATHAILAAKPPISTGYLGWIQYFKDIDMQAVVFLNEDFYTSEKTPYDIRSHYLPFEPITERISKSCPDVHTSMLFPEFMPGGSKTFGQHLYKLESIMKHHQKSFTYAYWTSPDLETHAYGVLSPKVGRVIRDLNRQIEGFVNALSHQTLFIIIADHGLVDVETTRIDFDQKLLSYFERMPSIEPRATNFFVKKQHHKAFQEHFETHYGKHFKLLSKHDVLEMKLFGDEVKHPLFEDFIGDFIGIATSHYMFGLKSGVDFKAHHAGLTQDELYVPLIIYGQSLPKG